MHATASSFFWCLLLWMIISIPALHAGDGILRDDPRFPDIPVRPHLGPWTPGAGDFHRPSSHDMPVFSGSFRLASLVPGRVPVRCDMVVPLDADGRPVPSAGDVIALFPWAGQQWLRSGTKAWDWARRRGFTIVTLVFPPHDAMGRDDDRHYYVNPGSGSAAAWQEAITATRTIAGLPARPWFVWGCSAGAAAAQQFASAHPASVAGAVLLAGRAYDLDRPFMGPVLLLHAALDREEENRELARRMQVGGWPPLHHLHPPPWHLRGTDPAWFHTSTVEDERFAIAWLTALANRRAQEGGIPRPDRWPLVAGVHLPDEELCPSAWQALPSLPAMDLDDRTLTWRVTSSPGRVTRHRGLVVWMDQRFCASQDDLQAMAQMLSDRGCSCIALAAASPQADLSGALASAMAAGQADVPTLLVIAEPHPEEPLWTKPIGNVFHHLMLVDPRRGDIDRICTQFAWLGDRGTVLLPEPLAPLVRRVSMLRTVGRPTTLLPGPWTRHVVDTILDRLPQR